MSVVSLLAQYSYSTDTVGPKPGEAGGMSAGVMLAYLVIIVLLIAGMWKTFQKAGQPGWAAIVPIYSTYILLKIAGRPGWWLLLYLVPIVNLVIHIMVAIDVAKAFGKSDAFGVVGLWLFSFIGFPMLGFGSDTYKGVPTH